MYQTNKNNNLNAREQVSVTNNAQRENARGGSPLAEKDNKTSTNKYAELRRTQFEIRKVTIDGKTYTVINATPTDTNVTAADELRELVKAY